MTKKYNQLSGEQRYKIEAFLEAGMNQSQIAQLIGVHRSTISRELKRNVPKKGPGAKCYNAIRSQAKTELRHKGKKKQTYFNDPLKREMLKLLEKEKYSPELISFQWRKDGKQGVSYETIYKFIWMCKHSNRAENRPYKESYKLLKHCKRHRKRGNTRDSRGQIPNRVSIEQRPKIVEARKRIGDYEVDLIVGKNHKSALLVILERRTLGTTLDKLNGKNAEIIKNKIIQRLQGKQVETITFDNDKAFSYHEQIAAELGCNTYFTRPYTSQDKGSIENRNGTIRRFFPKKTDFSRVHHSSIRSVENKINNRPVRKFNYLTPNEVSLQLKI